MLSTHPTPRALRDYLWQEGPQLERAALAGHLRECSHCRAALMALPQPPLYFRDRPVHAECWPEPQDVAAIRQRLEAWPSPILRLRPSQESAFLAALEASPAILALLSHSPWSLLRATGGGPPLTIAFDLDASPSPSWTASILADATSADRTHGEATAYAAVLLGMDLPAPVADLFLGAGIQDERWPPVPRRFPAVARTLASRTVLQSAFSQYVKARDWLAGLSAPDDVAEWAEAWWEDWSSRRRNFLSDRY